MTMTSEPGTSILAFTDAQTEFNETQRQALVQLGVTNTNRGDLAVFFHQCRRTGLDPFLKQIYLITRMTWNSDTQQKEPKATIQTGIDGFRLVVRRGADRLRAKLRHEGPFWCGIDGEWRDIWPDPDNPPYAAKYTILLDGEPFPAVAHFAEFVATKDEYTPDRVENGQKIKGHKTGRKVPSGKWVPPAEGGMPAHMIAKCAEALASRGAFPMDLSGVYIDEEMERHDRIPPNGKAVLEHVAREPSGEDWAQLITDAPTGDALNEVFFRLTDAGEMTDALRDLLTARGRYFRDEADRVAEPEESVAADPTDADI